MVYQVVQEIPWSDLHVEGIYKNCENSTEAQNINI